MFSPSNQTIEQMAYKIEVDGFKVIEEYLLTKGESVVSSDMKILFKPLIDFGLIVYGLKANATNRLSMKFDLERFFLRRCVGELSGTETKYVRVPDDIYVRVKSINDKYRTTQIDE
jgi:hypothetical protein